MKKQASELAVEFTRTSIVLQLEAIVAVDGVSCCVVSLGRSTSLLLTVLILFRSTNGIRE